MHAQHQLRVVVAGSLASCPTIDWQLATQRLISHSDGLCSTVYRRPLSSNSDSPHHPTSEQHTRVCAGLEPISRAVETQHAVPGWVCIKRVACDQQPRPHSVSREIALHTLLPPHRNLAPLLAAIHDTSDPFGAFVDLVLPLYPVTLEQVFQEPCLHPSPSSPSLLAIHNRPASLLSHLWTDKFDAFVHSVSVQLFEGLAFLHGHGVAHRDVKPANVLVSRNGVVKIIDLGTAYTTSPLQHPLSSQATGGIAHDECDAASMVCQVGTGIFRAPELLFAPINGYNPFAIDIWSAAVTLAHFFTNLVPAPSQHSASVDDHDERKDWQKAFDSAQPLSPSSPASHNSDFFCEHDSPLESFWTTTQSGYIRNPLFTHDRGDIALAADIFCLFGLPESTKQWPEAEWFQPPLHRLPFKPTQPKGLLHALASPNHTPQTNKFVEQVLAPALTLSASLRPTASHLVRTIQLLNNRLPHHTTFATQSLKKEHVL